MWKGYFYYSKGERRVLLFLIFITLLVIGAHIYIGYKEPIRVEEPAIRSDEIELFLASIEEKKREHESKRSFATRVVELTPAPFDPNLVDSVELQQMGLPNWLIQRILNYRRSRGTFPTVESLSRIYGMPTAIFEQLKPYVVIADSFTRAYSRSKRYDTLSVASQRYDSLRALKYPEGTVVDINEADTNALKMIPGIGSGIARMLVARRDQLGGFYSLEQLQEIEFLASEMWVWFKIDEPPTPSLLVNKATIEQLRRHPYLNFYQAKVIVEHRRRRGKIENLSQLSLYEEFAEKDLERLAYYLNFD